MLFGGHAEAGPNWTGNPFHRDNNVNGIDGDPDRDGSGWETQTLADIPRRSRRRRRAYVRKVIDTVNDLDNVLFEIANEGAETSREWQYDLIRFVKGYEKTKPKQHPVGMTAAFWPADENRARLDASPADWVSYLFEMKPPKGQEAFDVNDPFVPDGRKVSIQDSDHWWVVPLYGDAEFGRDWVWKGFCRGHNPILMEHLPPRSFVARDHPLTPDDPGYVAARAAMGQTRRYAERMDLAAMAPSKDVASTGYCLAAPGKEYLVYLPAGGDGHRGPVGGEGGVGGGVVRPGQGKGGRRRHRPRGRPPGVPGPVPRGGRAVPRRGPLMVGRPTFPLQGTSGQARASKPPDVSAARGSSLLPCRGCCHRPPLAASTFIPHRPAVGTGCGPRSGPGRGGPAPGGRGPGAPGRGPPGRCRGTNPTPQAAAIRSMLKRGAGRPRASRPTPGFGWNPEVTVAPLSRTTIRISLRLTTALQIAGRLVWKNDESPNSATARPGMPALPRPSATPTAEPMAYLASQPLGHRDQAARVADEHQLLAQLGRGLLQAHRGSRRSGSRRSGSPAAAAPPPRPPADTPVPGRSPAGSGPGPAGSASGRAPPRAGRGRSACPASRLGARASCAMRLEPVLHERLVLLQDQHLAAAGEEAGHELPRQRIERAQLEQPQALARLGPQDIEQLPVGEPGGEDAPVPCPRIRLNGRPSTHRACGLQPLVQGAVLLDDVPRDGHEPPGLAHQPQVRLAIRPLGQLDRLLVAA